MKIKQKKAPAPNATFLYEEDVEDVPLDPPILAYIGAIIFHFSVLDDSISRALFKMADVKDAPGYMLIEQLGISAKMKRLGNLVQSRYSVEQFQEFDRADQLISDIIQIRNALAHGVYVGMKDGDYLFAMTTSFQGSREAPEIKGAVIYKKFNMYDKEYLGKMALEILPMTIGFILSYFRLTSPRRVHLQAKPKPQEATKAPSEGVSSSPTSLEEKMES